MRQSLIAGCLVTELPHLMPSNFMRSIQPQPLRYQMTPGAHNAQLRLSMRPDVDTIAFWYYTVSAEYAPAETPA